LIASNRAYGMCVRVAIKFAMAYLAAGQTAKSLDYFVTFASHYTPLTQTLETHAQDLIVTLQRIDKIKNQIKVLYKKIASPAVKTSKAFAYG
jgi:hypothetical protein